mmetsp:Transcript_47817/g.94684  ORF Transcript_47817/g.94684 Transcript_47817/m.94684 type:complete len:294 (+) Transcript_47817:428-1309(+)
MDLAFQSLNTGYLLFNSALSRPIFRSKVKFLCFSRIALIFAMYSSHLSDHLPVRTSSRIHCSRNFAVKAMPSSLAMAAARAFTLVLMPSSAHTLRITCPSSSAVSLDRCDVPAPHLFSFTRFAMSNWSAKTGVTTVGEPAPREACVVPMPPWCTQHEHCGKSHSCGAAFMKSTLSFEYAKSSSASGPVPKELSENAAHPATTIPRWPATFSAPTANRAMCSSEPTFIEPQPMYTGVGPAPMKSVQRCSSPPASKSLPPPFALACCSSLLKAQRPVITQPPFGQSAGASQKASL